MELQDVASLLQVYLTELKCELATWETCIPIEIMKKWVKKVETRIVNQIKDCHE